MSESSWSNLKRELTWRKEAGVPVTTLVQGSVNWVERVGEDRVVLRRAKKPGNKVIITRMELEKFDYAKLKRRGKSAIAHALRLIAASM